MFTITRRRRNILLACGAVAAGGYVTYRIYNSRKRLRVFLFFESFSTLLDVLAQSSNSFSLVLNDLHGFLVSQDDEVPQSIQQLLKLASSAEAQESIAAVSAAVSRGLLSSFASSGQAQVAPPKIRPRVFEETKVVIECGDFPKASSSLDDRALSPDDEESLNGLLDVDSWNTAGIASGTKEGLGDEWSSSGNEQPGMVDKLAEKLFSEPGKGFASAMVATASRSFVNSVIEHFNDSSASTEGGGEFVKGLVTFARSADGKTLVSGWIQTFVGTAVSVYLDKTKDINAFDELAASLGNPEHKGPITDLVTKVCEVSTNTFVRTSHEVLTSDQPSSSSSKAPPVGEFFHDHEGTEVFYDMGEQEPISPSHGWKGKTIVKDSNNNFVEQISKVIAVPSNRKLILDIAGAMTSSAVRSTIDVSLDKVSAVFRGQSDKGDEAPCYEAPKRSVVGEKLQAVGDATKAVMDKSVVLMTMCFAVCLHSVVGGVRMVQPF
jgi:hypothetical protein